MKKDEKENSYKMGRFEIIKKNFNDKQILYIVDCDKSFCTICESVSCQLDFFLKNNLTKAKIFINEIYKFEVSKYPELKNKHIDKKKVVTRAIQNCLGYDGHYDFLFKGDKLISIKYDAYWDTKK